MDDVQTQINSACEQVGEPFLKSIQIRSLH